MRDFKNFWVPMVVSATVIMAAIGISPVFAQYIPPNVPTGVSATFAAPAHITVTWSAPTDTSKVIGYYVYRNGGMVANTGSLSFLDTVQPGAYSYAVASYDSTGMASQQSAVSALVNVTPDTTPPTAPANLKASVSTSTVGLSWTASTDNVGVVGYYVYRNGFRVNTSTISGASYTDIIGSGETDTYTVSAYDAAGNISQSSNPVRATTIFDVVPPNAPPFISAAKVLSTEIDLTWGASADNVGVVNYTISRNGTAIATVNGSTTSYADTGLSQGASYTYQVMAADLAGNVSTPAILPNLITGMTDVSPPSVPESLDPTVISSSSISLVWKPSFDNVGVAGYYVYRNAVQVATISSTAYVDRGLAPATTYTYTIAAYDAAGNISGLSFHADAITFSSSTVALAPIPIPVAVNSAPSGTPAFTVALYFGLANPSVKALQAVLIARGYLGAQYATGFFGALTQKAVQQFQCAQSIVCSGNPSSTGWGMVGVRTRKALNAVAQ